ncbi:unnamed protein product [Darwinula stevensoni]|uniref:Phospholipid/glycerol acyltransferase domain-containing protein n=1 Tax=Darwinula stevensoni TaxID=69355 RepID=A0A7R8ZYW6_9CRUS|nr:unnamed protein product [Darwinula stevensoni]CAG0881371.1 unnamed protein product [Darwinula stevensoni]
MAAFLDVLRYIWRTFFIIVNNFYCIPAYVVWLWLLTPVYLLCPDVYYAWEGILFEWLLAQVAVWSWSAGYHVYEMGDDVSDILQEKTLLMANHQSTSDVPLMMNYFTSKRGTTRHVMWIMDKLFKFTNFGLVSVHHGDFFIVSGKDERNASLSLLREHLSTTYKVRDRKWLILFPEGGFLRKRREMSQRYAEKNGLPVLEHVALPRVGALEVVLETLHSGSKLKNNLSKQGATNLEGIQWIVDLTIGYQEAKPLDLGVIVTGAHPPCKIVFHFQRFHIDEVPSDQEGLTKWIINLYAEKEKLLRQFYETGAFPKPVENLNWKVIPTPRLVKHNLLYFIVLHLFYIFSTVLQWKLFQWLWSFL